VAGEPEDRFEGGFAGFLVGHAALDGEHLTDAGAVEIVVETGRGPDRAWLDAALGQGGWFAEVSGAAVFKDQPDRVMERGLMVLGHEDVMGLAL
jgi:hypothetical protein